MEAASKIVGLFYELKIIIMAKIILNNGVLNVEESYDNVRDCIAFNDWLEVTEYDSEIRHANNSMNKKGDYRILVNVKNIQCVKP